MSQARVIALWQSGELVSAARSSSSLADMAARLGMTTDALDSAIRRARKNGHAVPTWSEARLPNSGNRMPTLGSDFYDEEPTRPVIGHATEQRPETGHYAQKMATATVQYESPTGAHAGRRNVSPLDVETSRDIGVLNPGSEQPYRIGLPSQSRWPHVEAFDAAGNDMLPAHGPGVRRSTLLRDGEPVLQWIKNPGGCSQDEIIEAAKRGLADGPRAERIEPPQYAADDLLSCIVVGDAHFGMLAWARECGESFNIEIAERDLLTAVDRLVALAPVTSQAVLCNIGDFVHADSEAGTTTKGTRVDVDSRWPKVVETAIRAKRNCISGLLAKAANVHDINVRGNHDSTSSVVMSIALAQFYEHEPRVTVDTSPGLFNFYRFGSNLLGFAHGHTTKPVGLAGVMSVRRRKDWGECAHCRWYNGHFHSQRVHEVNGVIVEHVPTLAALDAWAAGQGYDAMREIRLDVFHREHGLIRRHIVNIGEIRAIQESQ